MRSPQLPIDRIILARGAKDPSAQAVRERILAAYPNATVEHQPGVPPARVELGVAEGQDRREVGKRTLVLGSMGRVLDRNREPGMGERVVCYPYWHFNAVGNCPYDCKFCYLTGNRGNLKCPAVKVYTNLGDVTAAIREVADATGALRSTGVSPVGGGGIHRRDAGATGSAEPILFYGSKLQDFVALDRLTRYSETLVPFAADHPNVRLLFLTKSADIEGFVSLRHGGHTILSWTLNAESVIREYEAGTPSLDERLHAARRAAKAGYEVRFIFMPLIPVSGWRQAYEQAIRKALAAVRPSRITLGGICMYRSALNAMKGRPDAPPESLAPILDNLQPPAFARDRFRYGPELRVALYSHLIECMRRIDADMPVSLCLETPEVWREIGVDPRACPCNCLI